MSVGEWILLLVSGGLLVYLLVALLYPERF